MSDNITRYATTGNRQLSPQIWANCPKSQILTGHLDRGWGFIDDFTSLPTGLYTVTQATQGTFVLDDAKGGVALADCNSATSTQGVNVQRANSTVGESFNCQYGKVYFEALVKTADVATGPEGFIGLSVIDTTIIASSALSAQSIGFFTLTDDNVWLTGTKNGSGAATGTGHTFVDDTWVKVGFVVTKDDKVDFYVDGVLVNTETTYIPTAEMVVSFVCQSAGTTDPILHIDWVACFQAENLAR